MRAATLDGAISNLGDTWEMVMLTIAQGGIGEATQRGVIDLSNALTDLRSILDAVNDSYEKVAGTGEEVGIIHSTLTAIFETVAVLAIDLAYVLSVIGNEIGGVAAQAVAVMTGEFELARQIGRQMVADGEQARIDVDKRMADILGASEKRRAESKAEAAEKAATGRDDLARYKLDVEGKSGVDKATQKLIETSEKFLQKLKDEQQQAGLNDD